MLDSGVLAMTEPLKRVHVRGHRFYYHTESDEGISPLYPSVTTVTSWMPAEEQKGLQMWRGSLGNEEADFQMSSRADYGTLLHIIMAEYLRRVVLLGPKDSRIFKEEVGHALMTYADSIGRSRHWAVSHFNELRKDLISLRMFCQVYEFEPWLIEKSICSDRYGYAGTLDMMGKITVGERYGAKAKNPYALKSPGEARRVVMLGDIKSKKGSKVYPAQEAQLHLLKRLAEDVWPGVEVEALYKISPADWSKNPDFHISDVMESKWKKQIFPLLDLALYDLKDAGSWPYMTDIYEPEPGEAYALGDMVEVKVRSVMEAIEAFELGSPDPLLQEADRVAVESRISQEMQVSFTKYFGS